MIRSCFQPSAWTLAFVLLVLLAAGLPVGSLAADSITLPPEIAAAEQARVAAVQRAIPSTVCVFVPGGAGGGSGVLISPDGYALTNFHVSSPAGSYMRCGLSDGNLYDAVIVGIDPVGDLALIRLLGRDDFPVAAMADSRAAKVGDWCMAIGNPFLLATNLQPTLSYGILSGVGRYQYPSGTLLEYGDCLQTDAAINPGNSGGPLYDARGDLLGIIGRASFEKRGRVNVGVGYAISINQAKNFLGYLHSGRIVDHATLGATVQTDPDGGVKVSNILEFSDAYRRGLRYGAEVLEVDGRPVNTANDLQNVLATLPSGWRVKLTYELDGRTTSTLVRLDGVHQEDELLKKMAGALPPPPPVPQPSEKESDDDPAEGKGGNEADPDGNESKPKRPSGAPDGGGPAAGDLPAAVKEQLIERRGFANYHFNQVHQDRSAAALGRVVPAGGADDEWLITAARSGDEKAAPVTLRVGKKKSTIGFGSESLSVTGNADMYDAIGQQSLSAVVVALSGWQQIVAQGTKKFGETHYHGTMPLGGQRPLRDCLVGISGELEYRWLTHPDTELVEVIEVFADLDQDPAELWIRWDQTTSPATPVEFDLRYGTRSVLKLDVQTWKVIRAVDPADRDPEDAV